MANKKNVKSGSKKKNSTLGIKIIICVIFSIASIIVLGLSYANYTYSIDSTKKSVFKSSHFDVTFIDGSSFIDLTNEGPEPDEEGIKNDEYVFTINNDSKYDSYNKIYFSDVESTVPDKYIKLSYKVDDGDFSEPMTMDEISGVIEENKLIPIGESATYTIVMWISSAMPNEENGVSLMDTSYKSKITVESTQNVQD